MSIHENHRQRVKTKFEEHGLAMFDEHQALELLLFYCIPRRDTNEIAHRLINRFKSFGQVLDAPITELEKVEGVGHNVAIFLKLLRESIRYYGIHKEDGVVILNTIGECGAYLVNYLDGLRDETVYMLGMDAKKKVLCCREIAKGDIHSATISVRKVIEYALAENVTSVILAHNHPGGLAIPSPEDIQTTNVVAHALETIHVKLVDHIVVGESDYVSLWYSGNFRPDFN